MTAIYEIINGTNCIEEKNISLIKKIIFLYFYCFFFKKSNIV